MGKILFYCVWIIYHCLECAKFIFCLNYYYVCLYGLSCICVVPTYYVHVSCLACHMSVPCLACHMSVSCLTNYKFVSCQTKSITCFVLNITQFIKYHTCIVLKFNIPCPCSPPIFAHLVTKHKQTDQEPI